MVLRQSSVDLEQNLDPARTWRTVKALSGFPASTAFSEPQRAHLYYEPHSSAEESAQITNDGRRLLLTVPAIGTCSCYTAN